MKGAARIVSLLAAAALAASVPALGGASDYVPGLGEFMNSGVQPHHIKLWFAASARDWKLAGYEADELNETFADVVTYQRDWNGLPIAQLVQTTVLPALKAISVAIEARNLAQFRRAYADLDVACNRCHITARHEFVNIAIPAANPYSDQRFGQP